MDRPTHGHLSAGERVRIELLDEFEQISLGRLAKVEQLWAEVSHDPSREAATTTLLREWHSLKGDARMMGYVSLGQLAQHAETLVHAARDVGFQVSPTTSQLMTEIRLTAVRWLRERTEPNARTSELAPLVERVGAALLAGV